MINFMIRIILYIVVAVVAYNYFLGNGKEKESSENIVQEVRDVAVSVKDLLRVEKEKFDAGKYDLALEKIRAGIESVKKLIPAEDKTKQDLQAIIDTREKAEKQLEALKSEKDIEENDKRVKELNLELDSLVSSLQRLTQNFGSGD